jgi:PTH1 family peptidyl-tRNA hydrolase
MKIILAQGNPGSEYDYTRHNVGFFVIDQLADAFGGSWTNKAKFHAEIAEVSIDGDKLLLVKPTTYYNESGQAARTLVDFYNLEPAQDLLVIHDELALPIGTIRTRGKGSDAGNNGIKSLNSHIGPDYHRIRIGVASDLRERMDDASFVLSKFSKDEQDKIASHLPEIEKYVHDFMAGTLQHETITL